VQGLPEEFDAALLLPSRLSAPRPTGAGSDFYLLVKNNRLNVTLARISSESPLADFDLGDLYRHNPDERRFPQQLQWLTAGATLSLMIGALALIAATLAETRDRGQRMRGLRLLGTPWRHLVRAHFWSAGAPLLLLGWASTLVGWLVARGIRGIDDRAVVSASAIGWTVGGVLAVALIVVATTLPDVLRSPPESNLTEA
jgi:MFS family permease